MKPCSKSRCAKRVLADYEAADGNVIAVYTLLPEEIIREKVAAYLGRLKIRDLYGAFFLLRHVKNRTSVAKELKLLVEKLRQPIGKGTLNAFRRKIDKSKLRA